MEMEKIEVFKKKNMYNKSDSGFAFMLSAIIPIVALFALVFILTIAKIDLQSVESEVWYLVVSMLISQLSFLFVVWFVNHTKKISYSALKVNFKIGYKTILISLLVAVVCFFSMYNFIGAVDFGFKSLGYVEVGATLPMTNAGYLILNIILLGVLPAICEELVFRGIIFNGLRSYYGDLASVLISAGLFALMHGSLSQLIYPFIMGIIFSIIVLRTGNLLSSIIVHMCNNILVIIFEYIKPSFSIGLAMNWWGILLSIAIALVGIIVLFVVDKFFYKHSTHESMAVEKNKSQEKSIFMIIGIVVSVFLFVVNLLI